MTANGDRAAIRRLRRGIVPSSHVLALSVGVEANMAVMASELDRLAAGKSRACFIRGEWGAGKTHLLAVVRSLAAQKGYAVAYLNLNGNSAALNQPQRFYHLIATRLQVPNAGLGLNALLSYWQADPILCSRLQSWAVANANRMELASAVVEVLAHGFLVKSWAVITGADLAAADYGYKRDKALHRMSHLGECLSAMGYGGLVLALDEAEMLEQLWNYRSRVGAYSTLGYLVGMRSVLPVFTVTERFEIQIQQDVSSRNVMQNSCLTIPASQFLTKWRRSDFHRMSPTTMTTNLAELLVKRIVELYGRTYGAPNGNLDISGLVKVWAASPTRNPRNLIRRTLHSLDMVREAPGLWAAERSL